MSTPHVSVCIDVFNYDAFLPQAISSVLRQTFTDYELLIVDDCSTDRSFAVAQEWAEQDSRIRVLRNPTNLGMVRNRNACLRAARGTYVKLLHADDFFFQEDALAKLVGALDENPAVALATSAIQFVDAQGIPTAVRSYAPGPCRLSGARAISECLRTQQNLIGGPSSVLFRKALAGRGFSERYFHAADLEMWFHLLEQGCLTYLDEPLTAYRWHPNQQTEKDRQTLSQAQDNLALLADYLHKPYVRLRSWRHEYLQQEAVRQLVRRAHRLGQPEEAQRAQVAFGPARYRKNALWCAIVRKLRRLERHSRRLQPPLARVGASALQGSPHPLGINIAGFLEGEYGIGESSRAFCRAVAESELPTVRLNIESKTHQNRRRDATAYARHNPYALNLMTFSFDYSRRFFKDRGPAFFQDRYNVGLWYWELERFPARWHPNFDYYDEIWVPTEYCRAALAAVSPIPVTTIPYPLYPLPEAPPDRARFGIPEDACAFLFSFDFFSTLPRKNPEAVIAAFRSAFPDETRAVLVLKSINSEKDPKARAQLAQQLQGLRAVWIEEVLSGAEIASLFASVDCYVSLHRSEGLGLGMAQAMQLGKPVIATGYSGNLAFMDPDNSFLVPYQRTALTEDHGPVGVAPFYDRGNFWAEPEGDAAAALLRRVFADPAAAAQVGARGQRDIATRLSPRRTQEAIYQRIEELRSRR